MTEEEAIARLSSLVSRETMVRLEHYAETLRKWQPTINLVSRASLSELWARHMLDSAQIYRLKRPGDQRWLDLGSGGGFPGMVCAIMALDDAPEMTFTLIEADIRKGSFLREVARQTGAKATILTRRIEDAPAQAADVVSARALADLDRLCALAAPHLAKGGRCLFLKGAQHQEEIAAAQKNWHMTVTVHASDVSADSAILEIGDLRRA